MNSRREQIIYEVHELKSLTILLHHFVSISLYSLPTFIFSPDFSLLSPKQISWSSALFCPCPAVNVIALLLVLFSLSSSPHLFLQVYLLVLSVTTLSLLLAPVLWWAARLRFVPHMDRKLLTWATVHLKWSLQSRLCRGVHPYCGSTDWKSHDLQARGPAGVEVFPSLQREEVTDWRAWCPVRSSEVNRVEYVIVIFHLFNYCFINCLLV